MHHEINDIEKIVFSQILMRLITKRFNKLFRIMYDLTHKFYLCVYSLVLEAK